MASDSPLIKVCGDHGFHVEPQRNFDKSEDHTTKVVSFPCKVPEHTPIGGNITAIDQLELIKEMQSVWSDNSVSVTVYYTKEELAGIKQWLADNYKYNLKTVSFLLYHGHGFDQAPYETITKEQYKEMIKGTTPITSVEVAEDDFGIEDCASGACPVK